MTDRGIALLMAVWLIVAALTKGWPRPDRPRHDWDKTIADAVTNRCRRCDRFVCASSTWWADLAPCVPAVEPADVDYRAAGDDVCGDCGWPFDVGTGRFPDVTVYRFAPGGRPICALCEELRLARAARRLTPR